MVKHLCTKESLVNGIVGFLDIGIAEFLQKSVESCALFRRDLNSRENLAQICEGRDDFVSTTTRGR